MRRNLEHEADILRDVISVMRETLPEAEKYLDGWLEQGPYHTMVGVEHRRAEIKQMLQDYHRDLRERGRGMSTRVYPKQGLVNDAG